MNQWILTFNAGSSSIKLGVFALQDGCAHKLGQGQLDLHLTPMTLRLCIDGVESKIAIDHDPATSLDLVLERVLHQLEVGHERGTLFGVGHRVVHGGLHFAQSVLLDAATIDALDALSPLAPLHQPQNVRLMRAIAALRPGLPQIACFDTAFHTTQDSLARRFALPRAMHDAGVLRYGFHGISYRFIAQEMQRRTCPRPMAGSWWRTWAMAPACAPSMTGAVSTPAPVFRLWRACPWARAAARSMPVCCCT